MSTSKSKAQKTNKIQFAITKLLSENDDKFFVRTRLTRERENDFWQVPSFGIGRECLNCKKIDRKTRNQSEATVGTGGDLYIAI